MIRQWAGQRGEPRAGPLGRLREVAQQPILRREVALLLRHVRIDPALGLAGGAHAPLDAGDATPRAFQCAFAQGDVKASRKKIQPLLARVFAEIAST